MFNLIQTVNLEDKLFRYAIFNPKEVALLLKFRKIFFSKPTKFNDPFDCRILVSLKTPQDIKKFVQHAIENKDYEKKRMDALLQELNSDPNQLIGVSELLNKENIARAIDKFEKSGSKLLCLSGSSNEVLMWSHYANKHTGIAYVFNKEILQNHFGGSLVEVEYKDEYMSVEDWITGQGSDIFLKLMARKHESWYYEKEWRVIDNLPSYIGDLPANSLHGVIFGIDALPEDIAFVESIKKNEGLSIELYKAERSYLDFKIHIYKLDEWQELFDKAASFRAR